MTKFDGKDGELFYSILTIWTETISARFLSFMTSLVEHVTWEHPKGIRTLPGLSHSSEQWWSVCTRSVESSCSRHVMMFDESLTSFQGPFRSIWNRHKLSTKCELYLKDNNYHHQFVNESGIDNEMYFLPRSQWHVTSVLRIRKRTLP